MSPRDPAALADRARWIAVWALVALWLAAQAFDVGGNLSHLLLLASIGLLVYQLLREEPAEP